MNTTKFCKNIISGFGVMMFVAVGAISMLANHPVLVEGNCNVPPLQAAPGVDANIDAVLQGDPGSTARQGQTGILVNAQANRYVVIRNITIRNWASGIQVVSSSRVAIENCILEHNVNYGIVVRDSASVKIDQSEVIATGFRLDPATGDFPSANNPNPGIGISFEAQSRGAVFRTEVSGSLTVGISDRSIRSVKVDDVYLFDNTVDLENIKGKVR
ncbi:MAG: right-handed parallel beta-helix repeat-containing protein [Acidobacteria bacterium]|nr:right-handed parallel beta-helix repeat-containing protein [Acidobacteriota bacterium]